MKQISHVVNNLEKSSVLLLNFLVIKWDGELDVDSQVYEFE